MTRPIALMILLAVVTPTEAGGRLRRAAKQPGGGCPACAATTASESRPALAQATTFDPSGYLAEINRVRADHGLHSLGWSDAAHDYARRNAETVARTRGRLWHPGLGGAEIAARNQRDVAEACRDWLNSPGHRRILLGAYRSAGVAMVVGVDGQPVWFAQFE